MSILQIDMVSGSVECFVCGEWTEHKWGVPIFNGDIVSNDFPDWLWTQNGGGQAVCERCFDAHARGEIETFDRFYLHLADGFEAGAGI